ncbi:MAG TPA: Spy/CpxP family protein refolding chaperone [Thermodesulfovibrionales bacterium]|nr:Spy/CpxP family protein refolding chaperone [Thermodesulfovibrionales bacterium]
MKRVMVVLFLGFLFVVFGGAYSYAQMCGCVEGMGEGMGGGMPMMGGMKHQNMGMMGEMKHECMGMGMSGGMMGEDHPMWRHLMGLRLDEKQKDAIREIKGRLLKETIKKRAEKQIAEIELRDLLTKDPVDMMAVEAKLKQKESLETDIRLAHFAAMEEVKANLTPEQRKKMKEMMEMGGMMRGCGCGMMGGMMEHGGMGGAMRPSEKKD